jgi:hypothetical protein
MQQLQKPQQQINVSLDKTVPLTCDKCGSEIFSEVLFVRKISKILIGAQQDALYPIPVFACAVCSHVNEDFYPKEIEK